MRPAPNRLASLPASLGPAQAEDLYYTTILLYCTTVLYYYNGLLYWTIILYYYSIVYYEAHSHARLSSLVPRSHASPPRGPPLCPPRLVQPGEARGGGCGEAGTWLKT